MLKYKIGILGISETKKKGSGITHLNDGFTMRYSGIDLNTRAKHGVAIITNKEVESNVIDWKPINSRIISVELQLEHKLNIIQIYAPTDDASVAEKDQFYDDSQLHLHEIRNRNEYVIVKRRLECKNRK